MAKVYHVVPVAYDSFPTDEPETDYSFFASIHMYLRYEIKGTVDKNLSRNLSALKQHGYPVKKKIFPDLGRGGLAGEHPRQASQKVQTAHRCSLERSSL